MSATWSGMELNILRSLYPTHGSLGVRESLPHKSVASIRAQAARLGIRSPTPPRIAEAHTAWAVPAQDFMEQLACVALRKWRGPVEAGPLVATIGRVA